MRFDRDVITVAEQNSLFSELVILNNFITFCTE